MDLKASLISRIIPLSVVAVVVCLLTALSAEVVFQAAFVSPSLIGAAARVVTAFLLIYTIHRFAQVSLRWYRPSARDLVTLHLLLIGSFVLIWIGNALAIGFSTYMETSAFARKISATAFYFSIPFAAGALLLQSVLGIHYGLVFALSFASVAAIFLPFPELFVPYVLASCFISCLSLKHFRSRSAYLKVGLHVALILLPFALAYVLLTPQKSSTDILIILLGPIGSGLLSAFVAASLTPIVEYLGGYVTDLRLIEMATLDHPLLKDLSIQAPGTWNHSMVMGMMVEQAASSIDANPVLARVGAYFHDIGKMNKPLYFVENQTPGENRHDKLSTSMSALIIRAHVKEGIELARKHKLPKAIEDMIPQHHGTSIIEFFYNKAQKEAEEAGQDADAVDVSLYSYPGPKPQTREAGILMLADGVEAAARTLSEPTQDRIQGLVQKMINKVFSSGELNECELTLQDLHQIAKCFTRILTGIYHQRIAYDEPAEKGTEKEKEKEKDREEAEGEKPATPIGNGSATATASKKSRAAEGEGDEEGKKKENLKRLGM